MEDLLIVFILIFGVFGFPFLCFLLCFYTDYIMRKPIRNPYLTQEGRKYYNDLSIKCQINSKDSFLSSSCSNRKKS